METNNRPNMVKVRTRDAEPLHSSIIELDAVKEIYDGFAKSSEVNPIVLTETYRQYMEVLKHHKKLWAKTLVKYVGDNASDPHYRYDIHKKVIFLQPCANCNH